MARIRTIKPDFCSSKDVGALSRDARLFFLQLLTEADDAGRMLWIPRRLTGVLYPFDDDVGASDLEHWADECERRHMVFRYTVGGVTFLAIVNWAKHQKISHATESKYPPPESVSRTQPEETRRRSGEIPEPLRPEREREGEGEQGRGVPPSAERPKSLVDDPLKLMIDSALGYMRECGIKDGAARSLIGMARKHLDDVTVAEILSTMQRDHIAEPAAWISKTISARGGASGKPNRGRHQNRQAALEERNRVVAQRWAGQPEESHNAP